jgi:hypothetical protein
VPTQPAPALIPATLPRAALSTGDGAPDIVVLLFSWVSGDQFLDWGWRVPFWLNIVMGLRPERPIKATTRSRSAAQTTSL